VGRRRFDHLVLEISLAAGRRIPRWDLWMRLHELGWDPESLTRQAAVAFCRSDLDGFLGDLGLYLSPRSLRRVERAVRRFDPLVPTPYDRLVRS